MSTQVKQEAAGRADVFPAAAVGLLVLSLVLAALNGVFMKMLAGLLPALLIVWGRNVTYLLVMLPFALARHGAAAFIPPRPGLQIARVLLLFVSSVLFIWGIEGLPLADAVAIVYVYPFVLSALSPALLKEEVGPAGWIGVFGGFAGVLIVMRPDFSGSGAHALMVLLAGVLLGVQLLLTRMIVRAASPLITTTYTALVMVILTSLLLPFSWTAIGAWEAALLIGLGIVTAASQWFSLVAFSRAPAPVLSPFSYVEIPAAVLYGLLFFGDLPDALSWIGILVIIASGMLVARAPLLAAAISRRRPPSI
jgi:drug/metabolite transporter (DMT)-like permease